jgi:hypothetical protein
MQRHHFMKHVFVANVKSREIFFVRSTLTNHYSWPQFPPRLTGSAVGVAPGYQLDSPGIESRWGREFPHLSRPVLGPTHLPAQWVPLLSPGVKSGRIVTQTTHPLLVPWS